jgi:hypothetical protein
MALTIVFQHCIEILNEIWREKKPNCASRESRFAPNFIQNLYTVLKKRLWESRSTPTLVSADAASVSTHSTTNSQTINKLASKC